MKIAYYKPSDIVKLTFVGYLFSIGIVALLASVLSLFNVIPIIFNEKPYTGVTGFIFGLLFTPLFAIIATISTTPFILFGLWLAKAIFRQLRPCASTGEQP